MATSAVREAENRDEFLRRARDEAGVEVEVISGVEEARLIHLGVLQAVPVFDRQHLLVDIGGGSTEFVVGKGGEALDARSLKLGAIRLTERFFPDGASSHGAGRRVPALRASLPRARSRGGPAATGFEVAVGSSGTIDATWPMVAAAHAGEAAAAVSQRPRSPAGSWTAVVGGAGRGAAPAEARPASPGLDARAGRHHRRRRGAARARSSSELGARRR